MPLNVGPVPAVPSIEWHCEAAAALVEHLARLGRRQCFQKVRGVLQPGVVVRAICTTTVDSMLEWSSPQYCVQSRSYVPTLSA